MEDFSFGVFFLAFYHTLPHYFCEAVLGWLKYRGGERSGSEQALL
jgi:hypothetical protein